MSAIWIAVAIFAVIVVALAWFGYEMLTAPMDYDLWPEDEDETAELEPSLP